MCTSPHAKTDAKKHCIDRHLFNVAKVFKGHRAKEMWTDLFLSLCVYILLPTYRAEEMRTDLFVILCVLLPVPKKMCKTLYRHLFNFVQGCSKDIELRKCGLIFFCRFVCASPQLVLPKKRYEKRCTVICSMCAKMLKDK